MQFQLKSPKKESFFFLEAGLFYIEEGIFLLYYESMLKGKSVIIGVSGSIAAYKSAFLVSLLVKAGADVDVIMTKNACNFINPVTFETLTGHKCYTDTFDRNFEFNVNHVSLAKKADLFLVAPATANFIAKAANGLADDMLTTTFLASKCPKLIAPAMNTAMLENPATQENIKKCSSYGMTFIDSESGRLACGDCGKGKMAEVEILFEHIKAALCKKDMAGKKVLVTAGPTREALDPVRFITNHSSGKMGYAIAKNAAYRGAQVILVSGPVNLKEPLFAKTLHVESAAQMAEEVKKYCENCDLIVKAAAVADFTPADVSDQKIKKSGQEGMSLQLKKTEDILSYLGQHKNKNQFLCGFSMETEKLMENSRAKLEKKNLDMVCANSLRQEGAGFACDTNVITLITKDQALDLPLMSKEDAAGAVLDAILYGLDFVKENPAKEKKQN